MSVQAMRRESSPSTIEEQLRATLDQQRQAFLRHGPPSLAERRAALHKLLRMVLDNQTRIAETICEDFGNRSPEESRRIELLPTVMGIRHAIRHLRRWMRPSRRSTFWATWPSGGRVEYVPLGVVGVIAPWNYPFYLGIGPLTAALAAGNRVMIKPSELTPKTSELMASLLAQTFPPDQVSVITGGVDVAQAFSALPFDHLLFTGSTSVGRLVMRAASQHLVPVTLELGGKSPAIIDPEFPIARGINSLLLGKLYNAGQTCVAPDYLLVHESRQDEIVEQLRSETAQMYANMADNGDYTAIINDRHRQRLLAVLEDAREKGATVLEINPGDESEERFADTGKLPLTVLLDVEDSMKAMQEELFGPILPVVTYRDLDEAIDYINAHPRPLAAYLYSLDGETIRRVNERVVSGAFSVNATAVHVAQDDLPFGGVGGSGMGRYHAREGFEAFSHAKAIYHQRYPNLMHLVAPPYDRPIKQRLLDVLMGR